MTDATNPKGETLSRREMLEVTAAAIAAPLLKQGPAAVQPALQTGPKFFTGPEFALLEELSDLIIPTDAHSPGARAAGVAAYLDFRLADSLDTEQQTKWRSGLAAVDALSKELNGQAFLQGSADQRVAVLTRIAAGGQDPQTPAQHLFPEVQPSTVRADYTPKGGVHADQQYKGNAYQPGGIAGFARKVEQ